MKKKKFFTKKLHVKLGQEVKVISGFDKGKIGLIKKILKSKSKVVVEGVNIGFKHFKSNRPGQTGEIKKYEFPIHSSNVLPFKE